MSFYGVKLQRSDDLHLTGHPDGCTEDNFEDWCDRRLADGRRLAVDLFSGAGGLSLGLEDAGWTVAVSVDNDEKALQTHRHNFAGLAVALDLGDKAQRRGLIDLLRRTDIDLVAGGPPCQPFSRAGRSKIRSLVAAGHREEHDHRRELWRAFLDIAIAVRPRTVLMENVPDMAFGDDFAVVRAMVDELECAGYHTEFKLVDARRHGVPQHRKRLILVARSDVGHFPWPNRTSETKLREAIGDLPDLGDTTGGREMSYHKPQHLSSFIEMMRVGARDDVIFDHMTRPVRADDREIFKFMDASTLYSNVPEEYRRYKVETFDDKYKKLDWNDVSRSITAHIAKDGYWYIHPQQLRTLTVREAARVQTFPDRFRFAGTRSDAFRQIGNAVPPLLGRVAATVLRPLEADTDSHEPPGDASRWPDVRRALTEWARLQRRGKHWYALPGPKVTPLVAAVAALLTTGRSNTPKGTERALDLIRNRERPRKADLDRMQDALETNAARKQLDRFRSLLPKQKLWADTDQLADHLNMKTAEESTFRVLSGEDVLLTTQATLRVAARVVGSESDKNNRLSDGRVDLAHLIGAGSDAPLRAAALRLLGGTVCKTPIAMCANCPLRRQCVEGSGERAVQTLF